MAVEALASTYLSAQDEAHTNPSESAINPSSSIKPASSASAANTAAIPAEIAALIAARQATLLQVVKASQEWLTSPDDVKRGRGINLLGHVILKCPKESISRQETRTLADFFTSSFSSAPVSDALLVPTVQGLTYLSKFPHFGPPETIALIQGLFKGVELVGRPQTTRFLVYSLLDELVAHHRKALKRMGKEFLSGYCTFVTGEKDPRNLRTAFSIAKVLLLEFDIAESVEALFDITFCYFPITFTPPPNDPYGITSEELQVSLRECLSATPRFGPLALPLFIEKLQASTNTAKRQTLQALQVCFPVYGNAVVSTHAVTFWEAFSIEVFHASDEEMEGHALDALRALLATIYPDEDPVEAEDDELVQKVKETPKDRKKSVAWKMCDACLLELKDCDKSKAAPATKILRTAMEATGTMAQYVTPKVFSHLIHIYKLPDEVHQRPALFNAMASLLTGLRKCPYKRRAEPFDPFREEVLSIAASSLQTPATRQTALDCIVQMIQLPHSLNEEEQTFALQAIVDLLTKPTLDNSEDIGAIALEGLVTIAPLYTKQIEEVVLPPLFGLLPEQAPSRQDQVGIDRYRLGLAALAELCILPELFETLIIRFLARLETIFHSSNSTLSNNDKTQYGQNVLYASHILVAFRIVLEKKIQKSHTDLQRYSESVLSRLYSFLVQPTLNKVSSRHIGKEPRIIEGVGRIATLFVQQMDLQAQKTFFAKLQSAFSDGHLDALSEGHVKRGDVAFQPLKPDASAPQANLFVIYAYPLFAMRKEVFESAHSLDTLCKLILAGIPKSSREFRLDSAFKLLASLLNKKADILADFINVALPKYWEEHIANADVAVEERRTALKGWAWAMRGLIIRSESKAYEGLSRLLELFVDPALSTDAARTMTILSRENDGVITKENFAVIRLLYKQRFFSFILPKLVSGYHAAEGSAAGSPYLVGLSCLLQSLPKQTTVTELPKLLPLLLRALELPELDLRAHVIDTLALLVKDAPDSIKDRASQIVTTLLKNAICTDSSSDTEASVQLRLAALRCLAVFPDTIDWLSLHQAKAPVLKTLGVAVDDAKKRVRKEAVDCRARWYLFKAP